MRLRFRRSMIYNRSRGPHYYYYYYYYCSTYILWFAVVFAISILASVDRSSKTRIRHYRLSVLRFGRYNVIKTTTKLQEKRTISIILRKKTTAFRKRATRSRRVPRDHGDRHNPVPSGDGRRILDGTPMRSVLRVRLYTSHARGSPRRCVSCTRYSVRRPPHLRWRTLSTERLRTTKTGGSAAANGRPANVSSLRNADNAFASTADGSSVIMSICNVTTPKCVTRRKQTKRIQDVRRFQSLPRSDSGDPSPRCLRLACGYYGRFVSTPTTRPTRTLSTKRTTSS